MIPTLDNKESINKTHHRVVIIGGGQAGLSMSYYLQKDNIDHLVIEKNKALNSWAEKRWDSFSLVTPNWQCKLPGHHYDGDDPNGFMKREEIIQYLNCFAAKVKPPILENTTVNRVLLTDQAIYEVYTSAGVLTADQVVVASGGYLLPIIPRFAERIPSHIYQLHSEHYKNADQLPDGEVLVVGSGQSGAQIAEDLHLAGRKVHLATGDAPRCARFYRGRDVVDWLSDMKYYEMPVSQHPLREGVRDNTNHYVTGRDGGRDIDLRQFALEGMSLYGLMQGFDGVNFTFSPNLKDNLDRADAVYNNINDRIDHYIASKGIDAPAGEPYLPVWEPGEERKSLNLTDTGITSVLWCIGFRPDFSWLDAAVFNGKGYPQHKRGVTSQAGLYFLGLPWLYTWGSGRFSGIASDAQYLSTLVKDYSPGRECQLQTA